MTRRDFSSNPAWFAAQGPRRTPPNILFLISDDHSWPDLGCFGNTAVTTPNLDRLAREGTRFDRCFVSSPQCSPNRSSIFTGCSPHTTSTSRLHTPMPDWEPTIIDLLKQRGYHTGIFRKHHQGPGFERRLDFYGNAQTPFAKFFDTRPKDKPFFLQIGFTDPHRPYRPGAFSPPHDPQKVRVPDFLPDHPDVRQDLAHYYDYIARMDAECGQILKMIPDNTAVFMTGDNGMPFPRAKGTMYDPGIHVPLIAWWPGQIAAGAVNDDLIAHVDLPVTWLGMAGVAVPKKMQGQSVFGAPAQRQAIFSERNWHDNFDPQRCVRTKTHKLIFNAAPHFPMRPAWDLADSPTWATMQRLARTRNLTDNQRMLFAPTRPVMELYDLAKDPGEWNNLIDDQAYAAVRADLLGRLGKWMHDTLDYLPPAGPASGEPAGRSWPVSL